MTQLGKPKEKPLAPVAKEIIVLTLKIRRVCMIDELTKAWPEVPRKAFIDALDTLSLEQYPIWQSDDGHRIGKTNWRES